MGKKLHTFFLPLLVGFSCLVKNSIASYLFVLLDKTTRHGFVLSDDIVLPALLEKAFFLFFRGESQL
ncbi:MAG: hypothetical protein DRH04_08835 [Deltaproteobacteria bacterium]|nr:MAG: hypothetical protein DRH04_08835 [Deltaproteobacteria bacterium]